MSDTHWLYSFPNAPAVTPVLIKDLAGKQDVVVAMIRNLEDEPDGNEDFVYRVLAQLLWGRMCNQIAREQVWDVI